LLSLLIESVKKIKYTEIAAKLLPPIAKSTETLIGSIGGNNNERHISKITQFFDSQGVSCHPISWICSRNHSDPPWSF
jgi:hypothetical protein